MAETSVERYERLAAAFHDETGMMAPGKDDPTGHHDYDVRVHEWHLWLAARASSHPAPGGAATE